MTRIESRAEIGAWGEQLAVDYLTRNGLRVLDRNWRCRYGELDVIAADDTAGAVVFVEVKTRTGDTFGGAGQAVTPTKVRRLRRLAGLWLSQQSTRWSAVRIDVIAMRVGPPTASRDHPRAGRGVMALGRAFSVAMRGVDGEIVEIEADITSGLPGVHLVGLPDTALQESRNRVRAAITNDGFELAAGAADAGVVPGDLAEDGLGVRPGSGNRGAVGARKKGLRPDGENRASGRAGPRRPGAAGQGCAACGAGSAEATAGRPSSCRWTTWPRPAWSTASRYSGRADAACRSGVAGGQAGSRRADRAQPRSPETTLLISPMSWASRRPASPSRWLPPGRIT